MAITGRTRRLWDGTVVGLNRGGYTDLHETKGHRTSTRTLRRGVGGSCSVESWSSGPLALVL